MGLGHRFLITALLFGTIGMTLGLAMGAAHDFTLAPVHAHLNLLGYVSMFIAGLYYITAPEAAASLAAKVHYWAATTGVIAMTGGLAAALMGNEALVIVAILAGVLLIATMVLFILIVAMAGLRLPKARGVPAE